MKKSSWKSGLNMKSAAGFVLYEKIALSMNFQKNRNKINSFQFNLCIYIPLHFKRPIKVANDKSKWSTIYDLHRMADILILT